jgi:hypothetical protein
MPHAPGALAGGRSGLRARLNAETAGGIGWLGMMNGELLSRAGACEPEAKQDEAARISTAPACWRISLSHMTSSLPVSGRTGCALETATVTATRPARLPW